MTTSLDSHLSWPQLAGIASVVGAVGVGATIRLAVVRAGPAAPSAPARMTGALAVWLVGLAVNAAVTTGLLALLGARGDKLLAVVGLVAEPVFVVVAVLPGCLALLMPRPALGGFVGGLPLGLVYLNFESGDLALGRYGQVVVLVAAFALSGGMLGLASSSLGRLVARLARRPLPRD